MASPSILRHVYHAFTQGDLVSAASLSGKLVDVAIVPCETPPHHSVSALFLISTSLEPFKSP